MSPVERTAPLSKSVSVYQPIFRGFLEFKDGTRYLESDWVSEHTADSKMGYGKLFVQEPDSVQVYSEEPTLDWFPSESWTKSEMGVIAKYVHNRMCRDFEASIPLACSKEDRKYLRGHAAMTRMVDKAMLLKANQQLRDEDSQER